MKNTCFDWSVVYTVFQCVAHPAEGNELGNTKYVPSQFVLYDHKLIKVTTVQRFDSSQF